MEGVRPIEVCLLSREHWGLADAGYRSSCAAWSCGKDTRRGSSGWLNTFDLLIRQPLVKISSSTLQQQQRQHVEFWERQRPMTESYMDPMPLDRDQSCFTLGNVECRSKAFDK